jgi:putative membrane protein
MMYSGSGMGDWGMILMTVSNLLFWGLVTAAILAVIRYSGRSALHGAPITHGPAPQQLLAERFARGDIDENEYARRLQVLRTGPQGNTPGE